MHFDTTQYTQYIFQIHVQKYLRDKKMYVYGGVGVKFCVIVFVTGEKSMRRALQKDMLRALCIPTHQYI